MKSARGTRGEAISCPAECQAFLIIFGDWEEGDGEWGSQKGTDGKEMLEIQDIGTKIKNAFDRLMNK